jgi:DNA-binding CsgD family transcriptional regulator
VVAETARRAVLTLTSADRQNLETAIRTLVSPLEHDDLDAWRSTVNRSCKALLGADIGSFVLPVEGKSSMYSEEFGSWVTQAFPVLAPRLPAVCIWRQQVKVGVWCRETLYEEFIEEYFRTAYYYEYIVPARAFDAIGVTIPLATTISSDTTAGLLFHHDREGGSPFGERGLDLLRLLKPAFEAGVHTHLRLARYRADLARLIDATGEAVLLLDAAGREAHRTPALVRLLDADVERERLIAEVGAVGLALCGGGIGLVRAASSASREVTTRAGRYRIRATLTEQSPCRDETMVLVTVERVGARQPMTLEAMRGRFGLTKRQAQVAELIAAGRSNAEIARLLYISPHTAHHHTEQVLLKLDVHSRSEAARLLAD